MPRYSAPTTYGFQPLTSAHRQTMFLRNVTDAQLQTMQDYARDNHSDTLHPEARADFAKATRNQLVYALWKEENGRVEKKEKVGGGLGAVLNWVGRTITKPIRGAWNYAKNLTHGFLHPTLPGSHTRLVALAITETYKKDQDSRKDRIGNYNRVEDMGSDWLDVWKNDVSNQLLISVRGSRDTSDFVLDDARIAAGMGPRDLVSKQLRDVFQKYGDDYEVELGGHSLGGALIATALSRNPDMDPTRIDFMNPGTSPLPWAHDAVNSFSSDDRAYYYINAIDPVSSGEMSENPVHLTLNAPVSWTNPAENHSLDQWIFPQTF